MVAIAEISAFGGATSELMSIQPPQLDRQNCIGVMGIFTVRPNNFVS